MDWEVVQLALPLLTEGLWNTVRITVLAIVIGTLAGFLLGLMSVSRVKILEWVIAAYVDFVRGTPLLIQIFLVYFALPVIGIEVGEYWAGVLALSFNAAGFIAEVVRAGIGSIDVGQTEAAKSIGMTYRQILVHILLPQIYRPILPPLTNELITLVKGSALLSVISVYELTRAGQAVISQYFVPLEIYTLLALYYYVLISLLTRLSRWLERKVLAY
ncbi:amino acid ABC transporter permease [Romeria aff. gracilis LEGE 07310]|uniref:Amino acid ABC transporter permease n=1 Tax=Vasconcelosia minhoensis LEGE 07310 TaxID=915328 RepID=A0A8J7DCS3_9CYAN|nr:amino acid ABC transporter permease [Romeria aff. gracilis LEGE 07310]